MAQYIDKVCWTTVAVVVAASLERNDVAKINKHTCATATEMSLPIAKPIPFSASIRPSHFLDL